ncbi:MAG: SusD/RagB family nutrient-binding outer membrane lipoprotein [Chitinophagaceae bacterium]
MKKIKRIIIAASALAFMAGCNKDFKEINTNPYAITSINDPGLILTNILRGTSVGGDWAAESTIIQHFVLPYNLGATLGFNFNDASPGLNAAPYNLYTGTLRTITFLMNTVKNDPARSNLYNMTRIWKAYHYMYLVDHYGDVPYSEAERGSSEGIFFPKFDKASAIYDDLRKEIKEATDALDATKDNNSKFDIFVPATGAAATEITLWKKLGYSLLLRLGMRYSKADVNKAKAIVLEAYTGGVMQSNADNIYVKNTTDAGAADANFTNGRNAGIRTTNPYTYLLLNPSLLH